ncbi:MAG: caspase family protein [Bacteroidetes bacterium]|nr:MAG: caspase family protein [Bacteroidota bacterium]
MADKKNLYALLVGIQNYHPDSGVKSLSGCEKDVQYMAKLLTEYYGDTYELHIAKLLNEAATYANIIDHFGKKFLLKKDQRSRDVILFYYSGHGSREKAAPEFREFYPDGMGETIVCYDSRKTENGRLTGFDLADKELAALIAALEKVCPHVVVIMDCCHSGGGTRELETNESEVQILDTPRQIAFRESPRELKTYLKGFYARQLKKTGRIAIPAGRHILLSACSPTQQAFEISTKQGLFSSRLIKVLLSEKSITYADLFVKTRLAMRRITSNQDPQFETVHYFNAQAPFLNAGTAENHPRYHVFYEENENKWWVNCGAVHGLPTDEDRPGQFVIYEKEKKIGQAQTTRVGIQKSEIRPDFPAIPQKVYAAELISLPAPPVFIKTEGSQVGLKRIADQLEQYTPIHFRLDAEVVGARFLVKAEAEAIELRDRTRDLLIRRIEGTDEVRVFKDLFEWLEHLAEWEKTLHIQNPHTAFAPEDLVFHLSIYDHNHTPVATHTSDEVTLIAPKSGRGFRPIPFELRLENQTEQALHCSLFYFSPDYGLHFVDYRLLPPHQKALVMPENTFELIDGHTRSVELLKVFAGTEKMDDFLLEMPMREVGQTVQYVPTRETTLTQSKAISSVYKDKKKIIANDWFTKTLRVEIVGEGVV